MRKAVTSIAATALFLLSAVASADVAVVWQCDAAEGKTNDDIMALSQSWLDAAKELDDNISVRIYLPIAGNSKVGSFVWVMYLPNFTSYGEFMDAYPDSKVAEVDLGWDDIAPCEEVSSLYATVDQE